jgi:hypothetical protein
MGINTHGCQSGMNCFYIDRTNGNDSWDGTSKTFVSGTTGPWQNGPKMPCATGVAAAHSFNANDAYVFKGGEVWPNSCFGQWSINSGSAGTPTAHAFPGMAFTYDPTWNDGTVSSVRLTDSGDTCTAVTVTITPHAGDVTGSGATATATIATGYLSGIVMWVAVTNPGSNYTLNPDVSFAGSTCNRLPSAQAFITSPVWGVTGGIFGTSTTLSPMIRLNQNYTTFDGIDVGHYLWDPGYSSTSSSPALLVLPSGSNIVLQNMFIHHMGQSGPAQVLNSTMDGATAAMVQAQQADNVGNLLTNSWLSNWEITASGCAPGHTVIGPCGTNTLVIGMKQVTNNYFWGSRGNVYTVANTNDHLVSGNSLWGCLDSTSTQHPDSFYLQGGGVTNNNLLHDLVGGCAAFYLEVVNGATPVALGMTHYLFNNVIWNTGTSTPPMSGGSAEFTAKLPNANPPTSVSPAQGHFVYNNTALGEESAGGGIGTAGSGICGDSGQWDSNSPSFTWAFTVQNNECITTSAIGWRSVTVCASGCELTNASYNFPNGVGVWNGVAAPNGIAGQTALNTPNVLVTPAASGKSIATHFAPQLSSNPSVTFASGGNSTNLTSLCSTSVNGLSLAALCSDINGNPRPATGGWQAGAFTFNTSLPFVSLSPTSLAFGNVVSGTTSSSQTIMLSNSGSANLTITSVTLTGANAAQFNIVSNTCTGTIAALGTCSTVISFSPNAAASFSANVTYTTNALSSPDNVTLTGTGVSAPSTSGLAPTGFVW